MLNRMRSYTGGNCIALLLGDMGRLQSLIRLMHFVIVGNDQMFRISQYDITVIWRTACAPEFTDCPT